MEWQPIETAPDNELMLVWQEMTGICLREKRDDDFWCENNFLDDSELEVTHWMPLPDPPESD